MSFLKRLASDAFIRTNAGFFVTTMIASFLSYLFHPVLARLLSIEDYGEVQALLSLYASLALTLGVFGAITVNIFANADEHDHHDRAARLRLVSTLRVMALGLAAATLLGLAAFTPALGGFFRFRTLAPIATLALTFVLPVSILFRRSYLRGRRDFRTIGAAQILESGGRLLCVAALVLAGLRSVGAMLGVAAAQAAVWGYLYFKTRDGLAFTKDRLPLFGPEVRRELGYGLLILAVSVTTTTLYSADVLVVKHFFPPAEAGAYSGIATVAKTLIFTTGSISGVLVPSIKLKNPPAENRKLLFKALALVAGLGACVFLAFAALPNLVIQVLLGSRYLGEARLLPSLTFFMFVVAFIGPIFAYHLALRRRFVAPIGIAGAAFILALCAYDHASVSAIVSHFTLGAFVILAAVAAWPALSATRTASYVRT